MADDETTTTTADETVAPTTEQVESQTPAPETPEEVKPHQLQPGGPRFEEVYGKWKASDREAQMLREENERLRRQAEPVKPAAPATQFYSQDTLQAYVDAGKITPAQMAGQLALQAKEQGKQEMFQELDRRDKTRAAVTEINAYLDQFPDLNNPTSDQFRRVTRAAWEIADETGLDVKDPRVQKRALRETFGPLARAQSVERSREFDRRNADTYTETGGGGGTRTPSKDPLKDVEPERIEHWKRLGYTHKEMVDEAKFIRRPLRRR